jgi:hypothetical protein
MTQIPDRTVDALTKGPEGLTDHDGMIMAAGPDAVHLVRLVAIRSALAFEIETGMKMTRVSALAAANAALGTKYRRKQQALDHLEGLLSTFEEDSSE